MYKVSRIKFHIPNIEQLAEKSIFLTIPHKFGVKNIVYHDFVTFSKSIFVGADVVIG